MRARGFADRITGLKIGRAPRVDCEAAVHVLVVDGEFERIAGYVFLVAPVELDRERIHLAQSRDRRFDERAASAKIGSDVRVQPIERERFAALHRRGVPIEIHEHPPPGQARRSSTV